MSEETLKEYDVIQMYSYITHYLLDDKFRVVNDESEWREKKIFNKTKYNEGLYVSNRFFKLHISCTSTH